MEEAARSVGLYKKTLEVERRTEGRAVGAAVEACTADAEKEAEAAVVARAASTGWLMHSSLHMRGVEEVAVEDWEEERAACSTMRPAKEEEVVEEAERRCWVRVQMRQVAVLQRQR